MSDTPAENQTAPIVDENQLIAERRSKLKAMREAQKEGKGVAFPNDFKPEDRAAGLTHAHGEKAPETLKGEGIAPTTAKIAGRMMLKRVMGKASFATLQPVASKFTSHATTLAKKPTTISSIGTWATSWRPKAICSKPKWANCHCTPPACEC
jgi:lysyl-tRNA synthetase class 2